MMSSILHSRSPEVRCGQIGSDGVISYTGLCLVLALEADEAWYLAVKINVLVVVECFPYNVMFFIRIIIITSMPVN